MCSHPAYFSMVQRVLGEHKLQQIDGENLLLRDVRVWRVWRVLLHVRARVHPRLTHLRHSDVPMHGQAAQKLMLEHAEVDESEVKLPPSEPWVEGACWSGAPGAAWCRLTRAVCACWRCTIVRNIVVRPRVPASEARAEH